MATTTPKLLLRKPATTDLVNVTTDLSENFDKIDAFATPVAPVASAPSDTVVTGASGVAADAAHRHARTDGVLAVAHVIDAAGWSTNSSVEADVDATDLKVDFTAPTSGKVLIRVTATFTKDTDVDTLEMSIREGAVTVGPLQRVIAVDWVDGLSQHPLSAVWLITGISAGAKTYKLGWRRVGGGATDYAFIGGATAPVTIEAWAVP